MLLYLAERKIKADQWRKHCHSYSRKGIVAKVQPIEYDASGSHYLDSGTGTQRKKMCFRFTVVFSIYFC
jgi:hypothetical protein